MSTIKLIELIITLVILTIYTNAIVFYHDINHQLLFLRILC